MAEMKKKFKIKHFIVYFIFIAFICITATISCTCGIQRSLIFTFENIGYLMIAALSLSLVVGFLGELSLGHAAFMSIGAYTGVILQQTLLEGLTKSAPLVSLIIGMIAGGLMAGIFGFIIGLPALRLKGDYLAIVTLAFGEIVKTVFQNNEFFGGALGLTNNYRFNRKYLFIVIFVVALLVLALMKNLLKSKHGRAITSIRDNEIAARACGVNVTYYKLFVFVLSAFIAGVAGVLYGASTSQIKAATFNYDYSINNILVTVVLGGMGNINGTLIAACIVPLLNDFLGKHLTGDLAALKNIIYALAIIIIVIYNNAPALKWFREKYNLKRLWNFIKKKVVYWFTKDNPKNDESDQKQYAADWSKIPTKIEMDSIVTTDLSVQNTNPDKPDVGGK